MVNKEAPQGRMTLAYIDERGRASITSLRFWVAEITSAAPSANLAVAEGFFLKYHNQHDLRTARSTANWRWTWRSGGGIGLV